MSYLSSALTRVQRPRPAVEQRKFVPGPAVVQQADASWGADASRFSPEYYGNYLPTSNAVYSINQQRSDMLAALPFKLYRFDKSVRQRAANRRQYRSLQYRAISRLSQVSHRPLAFQRAIKQEQMTEVSDGALVELMAKVNPHWTMSRLLKMTELSMGVWGRSFWFMERGPSGKGVPKEIWWAKSPWVRVVPDPVDYINGFILEPGTGSMPIPFKPSEVIWLNYPNPLDEFSPLSPLAAARVYADHENASMQANINLHKQGLMGGGVVMPTNGATWDDTQAEEVTEEINKRFSGVSRAHRWGAFPHEVAWQEFGMTPTDAAFLEGMNWDLEATARAYRWPLDLIGGRRTYENVDAAMVAAYVFSVLPEASFIASELTEQLLPMFPGEADLIWFDASEVHVLQEAENQRWQREQGQIDRGVLLQNEWRAAQGMEPVPWGNVWWAPANLLPAGSAPAQPAASTGSGQGQEAGRGLRADDYAGIISQVMADLYPERALPARSVYPANGNGLKEAANGHR